MRPQAMLRFAAFSSLVALLALGIACVQSQRCNDTVFATWASNRKGRVTLWKVFLQAGRGELIGSIAWFQPPAPSDAGCFDRAVSHWHPRFDAHVDDSAEASFYYFGIFWFDPSANGGFSYGRDRIPVDDTNHHVVRYSGGRFYDERDVAVPMWAPAVLLAIVPMGSLARWWKLRRRRLLSLCTACGYDLRCSVSRCPECGRSITAPRS